ncbi:MAG: pyridoxal phosphate-dependent aminotransferase [Sharpea porci]|uniref:pyridoxal phosphate-dependent aminotransferase n=1 Tax=Sharpea porci TaxID=2652286 RepID=UPI00240A5735|nr:pyridoxal phosphate-dependent aminotransferase [Sharpea porci]MDD6711176.1 pyridoxal phosphate-dependent aminotransferase [Sharpea porci]
MNIKDKVSQRIINIKPSGIRKFSDYARQFDDVISLGVGEPDYDTPQYICNKSIQAIQDGQTHYTANRGLLSLRQAICDYYQARYDVAYDANKHVIVTTGSSEGIDLAIRTLIDPGDEIIIPNPGYVAYESAVRAANGKMVFLPLDEEHHFKIQPDILEATITNKTKVLLINYPNNPTGAMMTKEELAQLVPIIKKHELIVISDEIYSELSYDHVYCSLASFDEIKDQVITINGFSKAFAMTGWRVGYLCAHEALIEEMVKIHQFGAICANTPAQYGALAGLKACQSDVNGMRDDYRQRRNFLVKRLNEIGLPTFMPEGAFYTFSNITSTHLSSYDFCVELVKKERLALTPGSAFGSGGEGFVRISYAYSLDELKSATDKIEHFMKTLKSID